MKEIAKLFIVVALTVVSMMVFVETLKCETIEIGASAEATTTTFRVSNEESGDPFDDQWIKSGLDAASIVGAAYLGLPEIPIDSFCGLDLFWWTRE